MVVAPLRTIVLVLFALAGCAESAEEYRLSGSFTTDRTNADLADFDATLAAHGVPHPGLMESYPEQFVIHKLSFQSCQALRADLAEKAYLGSLSECRDATYVPE